MDLRTERTKRSIHNAFLELRAHKPLEKITIKELAELACINKATFYSHYHDIYDLSEQLENEILVSVLKSIPHPDYLITNPGLAAKELALALSSQNALFHTLFSDTRAGLFAPKLEQFLKEQIYSHYPEYQNILQLDIILTFIIQGGFYAYMSHCDDNIKHTEEVLHVLSDINDCLKIHYLSKLKNDV